MVWGEYTREQILEIAYAYRQKRWLVLSRHNKLSQMGPKLLFGVDMELDFKLVYVLQSKKVGTTLLDEDRCIWYRNQEEKIKAFHRP